MQVDELKRENPQKLMQGIAQLQRFNLLTSIAACCGAMCCIMQVDELKRENQKLLQIIAQLQSASIGCISGAPLATTTSTLGPDAEADGPVGTASCLSAGVPPDSIDSGGPSGMKIL